ncbi:MAG: rhodanese-like domain-containing protein [Planctomycetota bacterium]|jgi:glyoxylase-like metal-dependent hydrolase (beta-lactamase superfamily II)/rhodanese-related sulfurtransferase
MTMTKPEAVGTLIVVPFTHPQGCRSYLLADLESKQALAIDVHLDLVEELSKHLQTEGWTLPYVLDTHTHADHPSGSAALAARFRSTRIAHPLAEHLGVTRHPEHGDTLHLGDQVVRLLHVPGHTPDHMVLVTDGALFSGDSLFIGGVARTDFLGAEAGQLYDSLQELLADLPDDTILYPGHDYEGRIQSTLGEEKRSNPWLAMQDRADFVRHLKANPPPRPANMDSLLRLNREGVEIPDTVSAAQAVEHVQAGGATSVIDVRTGVEFDGEHLPGSRLVPLDQLGKRVEEVLATPAPRLLMCKSGSRAAMARKTLAELQVSGLSVVEGGIEAFVKAGGETVKGAARMSLERQVRIGAGSLVLLGVLLGTFVHGGFLLLAGFVGAGSVFAGITDWCGMGLLLARMPWNRRAPVDSGGGGGGCAAMPPPACAAGAPKGA